ncbi:stimulated by retinoic acid gene 6 protein-like [Acanthaster planci]|uniref:Stimulated by retinoic acid gene 6 protein-like n=1 Tax=Acanthaster planci TaxID=133434 RepID=A0A8B7ZGE3_ACAPL|nr:stimulated by retinoic acid gene 6 protein-like [Acanthaster planci]
MATGSLYTDAASYEMLNATEPVPTPHPGCASESIRIDYWVWVTSPISVAIILLVSLLEERVSLWPNCCFQRPGIPYPVNLVDSYDSRWSFASGFSVMSTSVLQLFMGKWIFSPNLSHIHNMLRGTVRIFVGLANVLLISLVFFPILLCLRIRPMHPIIGNVIGVMYTSIWLSYNLMIIVFCEKGEGLTKNTTIALTVPVYISYSFLNIDFTIELLKAIRRKLCKPKNVTAQAEEEDYFKKTHYYERVKFLLSPPEKEESKRLLDRVIRKIWIHAPGFRYSTRSICTSVLATITTYQVGLLYITLVNALWAFPDQLLSEDGLLYKAFSLVNATSYVTEARMFFNIAEDTFWIACYFAIALAVLYNIHVQICYREHTLLLWRGVRDFCPKEKFSLPALVVANLRFSGYTVAFSAWGFLINQVVSWLLMFFVGYFVIYQLKVVGDELTWPLSFLEGYWLTFVVGFLFYYVQVALAHIIFLQKEKEKKREKVHLSLDNRRLFHLTVYITLFLNVIVGLVSCLMRIIKAVFFGVLFIGRIDKCTLMRGWELWDPGFKAYLGFLQLEVAHTHPVLITFCHFLWKSVGKDTREKKLPLVFWKRKPGKKTGVWDNNELSQVTSSGRPRKKLWPRNKWFVALTLMRNRALTVDRMRIAPELQLVKEQLERERLEAQLRENEKTETRELPMDEHDPESATAEERSTPTGKIGTSSPIVAPLTGSIPNQSSTEAEVSRDSDTATPEPGRPATQLSMVAWDVPQDLLKSSQDSAVV